MWPEIQDCIDKNKHELRVTGKALQTRLEELDGSVPEALGATGPLFTFVELSGCSGLTHLHANVSLMTNLHGKKTLAAADNDSCRVRARCSARWSYGSWRLVVGDCNLLSTEPISAC